MRRRSLLFAGGAAVMLSGCWPTTYTWNQKLTIVVQTPDGEKSGWAVTEMTASVGNGGLGGHIIGYKVKGQATVVELGNGKYLFALLSRTGKNKTDYWTLHAFHRQLAKNYPGTPESYNEFYGQIENLRASATLSRDQYPVLATFDDLNDPTSAKEVMPGEVAQHFGAGFHLKSITLEITGDSENSTDISELLPWLGQYYDKHLDGSTIDRVRNPKLAAHISSYSFFAPTRF